MRYHKKSTIITSQLPPANWHDYLNDPTLADAILDRLIHNSIGLKLIGGSMRRKESQELHSLTVALMTEWRDEMLKQYKIIARKEAQWQASILDKLTALSSQVIQS